MNHWTRSIWTMNPWTLSIELLNHWTRSIWTMNPWTLSIELLNHWTRSIWTMNPWTLSIELLNLELWTFEREALNPWTRSIEPFNLYPLTFPIPPCSSSKISGLFSLSHGDCPLLFTGANSVKLYIRPKVGPLTSNLILWKNWKHFLEIYIRIIEITWNSGISIAFISQSIYSYSHHI